MQLSMFSICLLPSSSLSRNTFTDTPQVCLLDDSKPSKLEIKSECEGSCVPFAVSRWQVAELVNALLHGYLRF